MSTVKNSFSEKSDIFLAILAKNLLIQIFIGHILCVTYSYSCSKSSKQNKQKFLSGWILYFSRQRTTKHATAMEKNAKQGNLQCSQF